MSILNKYKNRIIITPHPGEMSKITKKSISFIQKNRIEIAKKVSKDLSCISVLKGFRTITADSSEKIYINGSGNEGMATGGMGDALTGIIASFIGQGYSMLDSSILGVFTHGKAGDAIATKNSKRGILASEIIKELPRTIFSLENNPALAPEIEKVENA